jgi:hypothetical protein
MIDMDAFLTDLQDEGCDIIKIDYTYSLYSEFGYSYDLIERVAERQKIVNVEDT